MEILFLIIWMNTAFGLCCIIVYVIRRADGLYSLVRLFYFSSLRAAHHHWSWAYHYNSPVCRQHLPVRMYSTQWPTCPSYQMEVRNRAIVCHRDPSRNRRKHDHKLRQYTEQNYFPYLGAEHRWQRQEPVLSDKSVYCRRAHHPEINVCVHCCTG